MKRNVQLTNKSSNPVESENIRKTGQSAPGPFKKSNHSSLLISATVDAFRGHGFSLLVTAFLRGLQLMLFPQKSPPALQSTNIDGN